MTHFPGNSPEAPFGLIEDDVPLMLIDPPYGGDEREWELFIQWLLGQKGHRSSSWLDDLIESARASLEALRNPVPLFRPYGATRGIKGRLEAHRAHQLERIAGMQIPDAYRPWAKVAADLGFTDFVSAEDGFRTELKSNAPWVNGAACGIYFWVAQDGETYVGKTVNARARLREHWRNHPDLAYASFQAVPASMLGEREKTLISEVEARFSTRNIKHALKTQTHVPFDDFVNEFDQAEFLKGNIDLNDPEWRELPLLVQKQAKKYALC